MSMSTSVRGIIPPDEEFNKMLNVYNACKKAGVSIPVQVDIFFDYSKPDPNGMEVELKWCIKEFNENGAVGYIIDLSKVPKNVKLIKFENSW